jgi:hypothetical protein
MQHPSSTPSVWSGSNSAFVLSPQFNSQPIASVNESWTGTADAFGMIWKCPILAAQLTRDDPSGPVRHEAESAARAWSRGPWIVVAFATERGYLTCPQS